MIPALVVPVVCAEQMQDAVKMCRELRQGLSAQVRILGSITDAKTAQAALGPLTASMQSLSEMKAGTNEAELWIYLDNTPGVKLPIIAVLEDLMVQLQRLEKANFFGNPQLRNLLAPSCGRAAPRHP